VGTAPPSPRPPEGVRLAFTDGTESPDLPVLYVGERQGLAVWEAMAPALEGRTPTAVLVAVCPPRTVVRLAVDL
jgi:hypothetical protein